MHTGSHASSDLQPQTRAQRLGATPLRWLVITCAALIGALGVLVMPATSLGATGDTWTSRTSAADNSWQSVTYGNGLFVAVASTGSGNRVMTSPDGITWTSRNAAADNLWYSVTYGNGLFVATASSGSGDRVMTSPDGITWTSRTSAANNQWLGVTYGNGLFVAVAYSGTNNRVMTSGALIPPTPATPTATAGNAQATITVAQGSGLGGTPASYTVTAVGDNTKTCTVTGASGSCTITGLTNGTSYTFTATAANAGGTSAPSGESVAVTPTDVAVTPTAPVNTFTMKRSKTSGKSITTQLNFPGPGKVAQVGTTPLPKPRQSSQMAKKKARTMTVCTARKTVAKAGKVTITCRLSAKARAARKTHSLRVRLVTTFTPTGGTAKSVTKTLVLKKTR